MRFAIASPSSCAAAAAAFPFLLWDRSVLVASLFLSMRHTIFYYIRLDLLASSAAAYGPVTVALSCFLRSLVALLVAMLRSPSAPAAPVYIFLTAPTLLVGVACVACMRPHATHHASHATTSGR